MICQSCGNSDAQLCLDCVEGQPFVAAIEKKLATDPFLANGGSQYIEGVRDGLHEAILLIQETTP